MSGNYFRPIKRIFLNLSGGTVTGDTIFTQGVNAIRLSGDTIYSGSTPLETIIKNISTDSVSQGDFLHISGGTGGPYLFTGGTTAETINVSTELIPTLDNTVDIGSGLKRFRSLNVVDGIAVNFTASTKVKTPIIELGGVSVTENNIILTGNCVDGGSW